MVPRQSSQVGTNPMRAKPDANLRARRYTASEHDEPRVLSFEAGEVAVFSRRGAGHAANEDAALVMPLGEDRLLLVVADGMGGRRGGRRASLLAIETLEEVVGARLQAEKPWIAVAEAIEEAGLRIRRGRSGAGTTLVAALVGGGAVRFLHSGDSQAVLIGQRGRVKALTVAHSPVGFAVESGVLDYDEALFHPARHLLSNALGVGDTRIEVGPRLALTGRDTVLLGSDGLFDNLFGGEVVDLARKCPIGAAAREIATLVRGRMAGAEALRADTITPSKADDLTFLLFKPRLRKKAARAKGASVAAKPGDATKGRRS